MMMRVGMATSIMAEKLRYLLPEMLVELMMAPLNTNMQQKKLTEIKAMRRTIFFERSTEKMGGGSSERVCTI